MFGCGERASRAERPGEEPFLGLDDKEGDRLLVTGELLGLGGGDGDTLRFGRGGGEAVLLLGGGDGEYLLWIGGEYLRGEGERRRGGGVGVLGQTHISQLTVLTTEHQTRSYSVISTRQKQGYL